jgi:hypothetical protein
MKSMLPIMIAMLGWTAFPSPGVARTADAPVPTQTQEEESSPQTGVVNRIDADKGVLEVDGAAYPYAPDVKVTGKDGKPASSRSIKQGARVEIRARREADGSHRIVEMRIREEAKANKEDAKDRKADDERGNSAGESR